MFEEYEFAVDDLNVWVSVTPLQMNADVVGTLPFLNVVIFVVYPAVTLLEPTSLSVPSAVAEFS